MFCGRVASSVVERDQRHTTGEAAMDIGFPVLAGTTSTLIFASSLLPMLVKAARTKDLRSYSLGNIVLSNVGNVIHSIYVFHLPAGPIWALHTFYLVATALMLVWYLRYELANRRVYKELLTSPDEQELVRSPEALLPVAS
jgi:uncharacterized protein with PQ loop repeat